MVDSLIGKTLGKNQIVELIGRGAMAEVYKAYQASLDRHVAIKLLHSFLAEDKNFLARFQREARSAAQLRHPNIVQTYDFDVTDGVYFYIVMEYINGYTLDAKLQELAAQNEIMPLPEAIRISKDVASALSYAHSHGMVHRDIKPSNVMLNQDRHVILTDFGIAKILGDARHTATGIVGTPNYISPEQGLGKAADARSDLYSLGAMFFQMVTGQLPYQADVAVAILLKHVNDPIPVASQINPALSPAIDAILFKAMAKNPDDRYQSAAEFITHLEQVEATLSGAVAGGATLFVSAEPAATLFLPSSAQLPSPAAALSGAVTLPPYSLSLNHVATDPVHLPAVCDADWNRAVDHLFKGYIAEWLREGVKELRATRQHGLADELELIAARAEAITRRASGGDEILRSAGLEEFLESLGAAPPVMDVTPDTLDLPTVGVGKTVPPITLTLTNRGRGYLCGSIICRVSWLKATPEWFGCAAGEHCAVTVEPDLSGLPAGRIQSADALEIRSTGGDRHLSVRVAILPSVLQVDVPSLDFGRVGLGEAAQTTFTLANKGRGLLMGRIRCRVSWLTAAPEQFQVPAGESLELVVQADSQTLAPGDVTHDWALMVESNGGHAILGVRIKVLSPHLKLDPALIDLGTVDLIQSGAGKKAELTVRNGGPGVLTGAVMTNPDWLTIEPVAFRCRSGESQLLQLATTNLKTGEYNQPIQLVSNAGIASVPVYLHVCLSQEPEMALIPAGWFLRGSQDGDRGALPPEKPQRQIYLSEYWIGKYPVTNVQYAVFIEATGRRPPDHWIKGHPPEGQENHPVVNVSWWDGLAYCRWLVELTGKPYRLPTEAQWEKAARGSDGRTYPWGNDWNSHKCNTHEGGKRGTTPAGEYSPAGDSPYGCADMAGNVLEWVSDWHREDYYTRSSAANDPFGPASGVVRGLRGGSWSSDRQGVRCAGRAASSQTTTNSQVGFRVAVFATPQAQAVE